MEKNCSNCANLRSEDGCRWCDKGILPPKVCKAWSKRLTKEEYDRVTNMMEVWQYLYDNKQWELCDLVSHEIASIKEVEG